MEFSISNEKKLSILDGVKQEAEAVIYRLCLTVGVNPDEINTDWTPPSDTAYVEGDVDQLLFQLARLKTLENQIALLS